jgi:hypothetical protein
MNVDMENLCYNDWKSRQFIKLNEDRYKEQVAKNPNARLVDELLNKLKFDLLNKELKNYINKEI